jgi:hypothetical protein
MKCPYQNSLVPPCKIDSHPQRDNVEYCKVCGEWRYLSDVGDEFPNVFWVIVTMLTVGLVMVGLLKEDEALRRNNFRRYGRESIGCGNVKAQMAFQLDDSRQS